VNTTGYYRCEGGTGSGNFDQYLTNLTKKVGKIEVRPVFDFVTTSGALAQAIDDEPVTGCLPQKYSHLASGPEIETISLSIRAKWMLAHG
jgi:hypothetical protein